MGQDGGSDYVKTGYFLERDQHLWLKRQARTRSDATGSAVTESQVLRDAVQSAMDAEQADTRTAAGAG